MTDDEKSLAWHTNFLYDLHWINNAGHMYHTLFATAQIQQK